MSLHVDAGAALAIDGGPPVRSAEAPWPRWPVAAPGAEDMLRQVLHSRQWAITSPHEGELFERRFAEMFAGYLGARHCVPTDHGSSALVIALESLGLSEGDAVLVPALTWVATATAVLRAGLLPVLADIDPRTGSMAAGALSEHPDIRAVVVVHWACGMADVPAIDAVAAPRGIAVIEDAAQAHGARWAGRAAGTLGRLGCFSMQHSKVLTCGEGGAVVTGDEVLAGQLEELRADSRRYRGRTPVGELPLAETATTMGANFCLSEFGAALLCAQLPLLDAQHVVRNRNYELLRQLLASVAGVRLLDRPPEQDALSLYEVPIIFDPLPAGSGNTWAAAALTAEISMRAYPPRAPLHRSPLLQPWKKSTIAGLAGRFAARHRDRVFPHAEYLARHAVLLHHSAFLGAERDMRDLARAVAKVARHAERTAGRD
ncbi:DegT/DnrJ/EryC1/StrS family aminotransferase [Actinoplanes siamensis]|uniref:Aminotransferase DegT n=1 Tax=Actinoplanes siamensis TaxID=1223317 RepID=A0A919N9L0_9ACTN|nr:DegT/DnrJ/EryC1/StrS family aminotransferase [Actinoplanes siamensis]GIF06888.1 aminotransferase DegT [Actinoplanes siamensis]